MNKKQKSGRAGTAPHVTEPAEVSLADLEKMCHEPVVVKFKFKEKPMKFTGRPLTPAETARVDLILRKALPPLLPPAEAGGEARLDFRDPKFLEDGQRCRQQARALALYLAFPQFAELKPGLQNLNDITDFIQSMLNEKILSMLWEELGVSSGLDEARLNF